MEQRVAAEPQGRRGPHQDAQLAPLCADREAGTDEQEDDSDVADEMLVERSGRRHAGHREIPIGRRYEHEAAVGHRKYRQHPSSKGIPIILLTTESDEELKRQAKEAGATGWIVKPFKQDQLLAIIKKVTGA